MAKGKITQHSEENGSIDGIDKIPIIWRKLSDLTPNKDNPRTITKEDYNRLKNSMLRNPQMINAKPLLLSNRTGELVIIGGNQRFAVARAMGRTELPNGNFKVRRMFMADFAKPLLCAGRFISTKFYLNETK